MLVSEKKSIISNSMINNLTIQGQFLKYLTSINYNSRYFFWKFSKDENAQSDRSNQPIQTNQNLKNASKYDNKFSERSFFNLFKKNSIEMGKQQQNVKNNNYYEKIKNSQLKFLFQDQVSKIKDVGKASQKYFLIGIFILGFAYSIPKSISTFMATKMAISAQLSIENLKKENEFLKSKLEFVKNQIQVESSIQNQLKQQNKY